MKALLLTALAGLLCLTTLPAQAHSSTHIRLGFNFGCCGYAPYYEPYYRPFYSGYPTYYVPPPTVIYETPPQVIYSAPPPVTYVVPSARQALPATQSSPDFVDYRGRTCRNFETVLNGDDITGTACLQADGTWRTVGE